MKKLLLLLFLLSSYFGFSQKANKYSIELQGNYTYYFVYEENYDNLDFRNYLNGGVTILIKKSWDRLKTSFGLNYSTKNYYNNYEPTSGDDYTGSEYYINYLNFPFLAEYKLVKKSHFGIGLLQGIIFNYRIYYYKKRNFLYHETQIFQGSGYYKKNTAASYRAGIVYSHNLSSQLSMNITPFFDYKFFLNREAERPDPRHLQYDRVSCGLNFGLEYKF